LNYDVLGSFCKSRCTPSSLNCNLEDIPAASRLHDVHAVQTIHAIRPQHTRLRLDNLLVLPYGPAKRFQVRADGVEEETDVFEVHPFVDAVEVEPLNVEIRSLPVDAAMLI
jgi:hypothetical protein